MLSLGPVRIAAIEAGPQSGPLALCLHGFPDAASTWAPLLERLAREGFHAVAPYLRGFAPSGLANDDCYRIEALVWDALQLYERFDGDGNAVIVGHDWGADIAHHLLAHRPNAFRRAVTMSLPPSGDIPIDTANETQMRRSWYAFMLAFDWSAALMQRDDFALLSSLCRQWSPNLDHRAHVAEVKQCFPTTAHCAAATALYRDMMRPRALPATYASLERKLSGAISTPVLYMHGANDGCIDPALTSLAHQNLPGSSRVELLHNVGHFPHLEATNEVADRIANWLTRSES